MWQQDLPHDIGKRIRAARQKKGWSQIQLANHISLTQAAISQIEHGQRKTINKAQLELIAHALEVPEDTFIQQPGDNLTHQLSAGFVTVLEQVARLPEQQQEQLSTLIKLLLAWPSSTTTWNQTQ